MWKPKSESEVLPWMLTFSRSIANAVLNIALRYNETLYHRLLQLTSISLLKTPPKSSNGVRVTDITVDSTRNLWYRLFLPSADSSLPVVVFFHGGGFAAFSADHRLYDAFCRGLASKLSAAVVSVNYRLSPQHKYPSAYDDGFDTLRSIDNHHHHSSLNLLDLSRCFLAGDSAGANIAHHVARRFAQTSRSSEIGFSELKIIGLIAIQPFFGGEERTESEIRLGRAPFVSFKHADWYWKSFLPEGENRDHEAVNVFGPRSCDISGLENFPDTLVIVSGYDPLQDWQRRYYDGLRRSGIKAWMVEYPNTIHSFNLVPELPESSLMVSELHNFIHRCCEY